MATVRAFNTEGPVVATDHYHIPPLERIDLDAVLGLIQSKKYFVLHAPRQTAGECRFRRDRYIDSMRLGDEVSVECANDDSGMVKSARMQMNKCFRFSVITARCSRMANANTSSSGTARAARPVS